MKCLRCKKTNIHGETYCRGCEDDLGIHKHVQFKQSLCVECQSKKKSRNSNLCIDCKSEMMIARAVNK